MTHPTDFGADALKATRGGKFLAKNGGELASYLSKQSVRKADEAVGAQSKAINKATRRADEVAEEARERALKKKKQEANPCPNLSLAAVAQSRNLAAAATNGGGCGVPNLQGR